MKLLTEFTEEVGAFVVPVVFSTFEGNPTYYYPGDYVVWLENRLNKEPTMGACRHNFHKDQIRRGYDRCVSCDCDLHH